ncbi:leucine--tRNA ligase [Candidatus Saccharibacteria bacterium]|nr:MAG: leucine--tRNA ligase [Candidatus Saccharibacteria bacterium]
MAILEVYETFESEEIEPKWQAVWDEEQVYKADLTSDKPKYIAMSMFNYPSGAGIHIGHAMNYTISDVMARFKRQQGFESYHPVGWDAFGLPAENYAIKAGVSPQQSMAKIIPSYHTQYKAMGWSNDWSKEISTHLPEYYRWTQWIFAEMYKKGLAYQDSRMQWWCTKCQTVLANEQVIDGKCWRHDSADDPEVNKKEVKQWFFKITDYADELLEATYDLDWSEVVKTAQINWIGKSEGAEVSFAMAKETETRDKRQELRVFTTRPDTLFGATFMVMAPEHPLVPMITSDEQRSEIEAYTTEAAKKDEVTRQENKEKTGVFTGAYAVNPINGATIPIWVADYVLMGYGTGAIMAVPAHDERDHEFAEKFDLPVLRVVKNDTPDEECSHDEGIMMNSGEYDGMASSDAREKIVSDLTTKGLAEAKTNYKIRDWSVSRQRYWGAPIPIIHCPKDGIVLDENLPVVLPELRRFCAEW